MQELLMNFLLNLNEKGLINNHDFDFEKEVRLFSNRKEQKKLVVGNTLVSPPTSRERKELPENVRVAYCYSVDMYHNIYNYLLGIIDAKEFIEKTKEIADKYKDYEFNGLLP